jgi:hypothetical protein
MAPDNRDRERGVDSTGMAVEAGAELTSSRYGSRPTVESAFRTSLLRFPPRLRSF